MSKRSSFQSAAGSPLAAPAPPVMKTCSKKLVKGAHSTMETHILQAEGKEHAQTRSSLHGWGGGGGGGGGRGGGGEKKLTTCCTKSEEKT